MSGIYAYRVTNIRTKITASYGYVLVGPDNKRPTWLNCCPLCGTSFETWQESGRKANGTIA